MYEYECIFGFIPYYREFFLVFFLKEYEVSSYMAQVDTKALDRLVQNMYSFFPPNPNMYLGFVKQFMYNLEIESKSHG
jgi:hypothetical protein